MGTGYWDLEEVAISCVRARDPDRTLLTKRPFPLHQSQSISLTNHINILQQQIYSPSKALSNKCPTNWSPTAFGTGTKASHSVSLYRGIWDCSWIIVCVGFCWKPRFSYWISRIAMYNAYKMFTGVMIGFWCKLTLNFSPTGPGKLNIHLHRSEKVDSLSNFTSTIQKSVSRQWLRERHWVLHRRGHPISDEDTLPPRSVSIGDMQPYTKITMLVSTLFLLKDPRRSFNFCILIFQYNSN